jgi:hypothetical protein
VSSKRISTRHRTVYFRSSSWPTPDAITSRLFRNAQHERLLTAAPCGGLRPPPARRPRGAFPHLPCSTASSWSFQTSLLRSRRNATRTPEGRSRAYAQLLPQPHWPLPMLPRLGTFTPTVALSTPYGSSKWVKITTLQCSLYVAASSVANLLGHRPRLLAGPLGSLHPGFRLASHLLEAPDNATGASWVTPRAGLAPAGRIVLRAAHNRYGNLLYMTETCPESAGAENKMLKPIASNSREPPYSAPTAYGVWRHSDTFRVEWRVLRPCMSRALLVFAKRPKSRECLAGRPISLNFGLIDGNLLPPRSGWQSGSTA